MRIALTTAQHGFDALDQNLVYFSALMTDAYDDWYRQWAQTVQVPSHAPAAQPCASWQAPAVSLAAA